MHGGNRVAVEASERWYLRRPRLRRMPAMAGALGQPGSGAVPRRRTKREARSSALQVDLVLRGTVVYNARRGDATEVLRERSAERLSAAAQDWVRGGNMPGGDGATLIR